MVARPRRDEVWLVALDPVVGAEIQKTRPCVVISPDILNQQLHTVIVAPMSTKFRTFPFRVDLSFQGKAGQVKIDHSRAVSLLRLIRKVGAVSPKVALEISTVLAAMYQR